MGATAGPGGYKVSALLPFYIENIKPQIINQDQHPILLTPVLLYITSHYTIHASIHPTKRSAADELTTYQNATMKLATVFTAVYALALTSTATPVPGLDKRVSWPCGGTGPCPILISEFTLFSTTNDCDAADAIGTFTYYKGYDSDKCHSVSELAGAATGVFGVSEIDGDKKCQREFIASICN